jgi:hypothetical protein
MTTRLEPSQHSGSREHARDLVAELPSDMVGASVVLDCTGLVVGTPSFLDEIVKEVLVVRRADRLEVVGGSVRILALAEQAAANRGVADRLSVASRAA